MWMCYLCESVQTSSLEDGDNGAVQELMGSGVKST